MNSLILFLYYLHIEKYKKVYIKNIENGENYTHYTHIKNRGDILKEIDIQNTIRNGINDIAVIFRINVGSFKVGDRIISTGVPKGFPDLFGFRRTDGKAIFLEVKTPKGKLRKEQEVFKEALSKQNVIYGVARSLEEAREIILRT